MSILINLSVHDVVDALLRKGSIDTRVFSSSTMQEGVRLHSQFQSEQTDNYLSEVSVKTSFSFDDYTFVIDGRADGIIVDENSITIDEIKTTVEDLDKFYEDNKEWHLGQAKFYAYIYATEHDIKNIKIRLTYISQIDYKKKKHIYFSYQYDDIKNYIFNLMNDYYEMISFFLNQNKERAKNLKDLAFPYPSYRQGQKDMIEFLEDAIEKKKFVYIEAPTGTGKTASSLFPFLKKLGDNNEKVFYLTSKNSIKLVALDNIRFFNANGAKIKAITISSKENMCINDKKRQCNPDECPYAKDYYSKINELVRKTVEEKQVLDYNDILYLGEKYMICPFEFQLDLSLYYDVIIADYNHLFSPTAHLSRFFDQGKKPYYLLIDECHNLPGRVREIYSSSLAYYDFYDVLKDLRKHTKGTLALRKNINNIIEYYKEIDLTEMKEEMGCIRIDDVGGYFIKLLNKFVTLTKELFKDHPEINSQLLVELYYNTLTFLELPSEEDTFASYYTVSNKKVMEINIVCLDSREYIKNAKRIFESGVFFSATLSPINFYLDLFKAEDVSSSLILPSPFPKENFNVMIHPLISTLYKDRSNTLIYLKEAIINFVSEKTGNYFIFFPSYAYMTSFLSIFHNDDSFDIYVQDSMMKEDDRNKFLSKFKKNPDKTCLGFVVMGGSFSEGIDLVDDRLIGAIIIGVGLPKLCYKNDLLKNYYSEEGSGYDYAYTYPGINKVMQSLGRVIRSENDVGMVLLIDTRYQAPFYKNIINDKYPQAQLVFSGNDIKRLVKKFYERRR